LFTPWLGNDHDGICKRIKAEFGVLQLDGEKKFWHLKGHRKVQIQEIRGIDLRICFWLEPASVLCMLFDQVMTCEGALIAVFRAFAYPQALHF